ncbi:hydroxymethylbilane synthase [Methylocella sp. CPCC 101449]|uniref:hydroxymethylbilane synthase n=1 Tax=Methylocella sp. CPCC 101449 TaxID=2987531 RepID=UPI00288E2F69|nr:hydroxymethylbilane synthase [Methylocella sp. CPCC 101449]MDT2020977.1 hydroxymethylbilane synthase [Methylocella sp. CPCC 101449]
MNLIRIGTRGSQLALAQAHETRRRLMAAHGLAEAAIEIVPIRTTGDMIQDRALAEAGGKGLFTRELDAALVENRVDLTVHSSKDLPTILPDEIEVSVYLPREDVRDVLIARDAKSIADLKPGARVGSASLRRGALLKRLRPDVQIGLLRGNVETRLRRIADGDFDATLLALAGLKRLGLEDRAAAILSTDEFPPAVGQGAIGITARKNDAATRALLQPIGDIPTGQALTAERAFLRVLDGSCRTPIAGLATVKGDRLTFSGMILRTDGSEWFEIADEGPASEALAIGERAGQALLARAPTDILG